MSWPAAVPVLILPAAAIGRQAKRAMLAAGDECQDLGDRLIFRRHRLHRLEALGEETGAVKQLLIDAAHGRQPLLGELAPLHADEVEALEHGILPVGEAERNDIAAHAA